MSVPYVELLARGARLVAPEGDNAEAVAEPSALTDIKALFVVDLEMSGPNPLVHEVLDVGGVLARLEEGLPEVDSYGARVKPKRIGNAEPAALRVVGYSSKAWKDATTLEAAFEQLSRLGEHAAFTGWGIGQDLSFLQETYRQLGKAWPFASVVIDVQPIARHLLQGTGSVDRFNLGHVADRLGIGRMGEHGALADAYATYDVLVKLIERAANASHQTS